jgi:hypothetical protein
LIRANAEIAFRRTRELFKISRKSANKKYATTSPVSAAKLSRRTENQQAALHNLRAYRAMSRHWQPLQIGNDIINMNATGLGAEVAGNCTEMSCVALAYLRRQGQDIPARIVSIARPGDHVFLLVGGVALLDPADPPSSVSALCVRASVTLDSYVLDPWAGVFCQTRNYFAAFVDKMRKWEGREKEVFDGSQWARPNVTYIGANMFLGRINWHVV